MFLTVTMNPSIDISYPLEHLKINTINRVQDVSKTPGGKGLNVARVLHDLKAPVMATGIVGGQHGEFIRQELDRRNLAHHFSTCAGETRDCIAILHDGGQQTEILEAGPHISTAEACAFLKTYQDLLEDVDFATISGSLAQGLPTNFYAKLLAESAKQNVPTLLDCSGSSLAEALRGEAKPYGIKPNEHELSQLLQQKISAHSADALKTALQHPLFRGIELIVVSLGAAGAFAKYQEAFYRVHIPEIEVVNPVGSGDATLAGLAYALGQNKNIEDVLKTGMTTGMLNAREAKTGHINPDHFTELYDQIQVEEI